MERKSFIRNLALGGSILFTAPALFNACSKDEMPDPSEGSDYVAKLDLSLSKYDNLDTVGGYIYEGNLIVIRASDSQFLALSKICTHKGCEVDYDSTNNILPCPCHGSQFDTGGNVLHGPATTNLASYSTKLEDNMLVIS